MLKIIKTIKAPLISFTIIVVITIIIATLNNTDLSEVINDFAHWAYPSEEDRNGKILQLILNILAGLAVLYGLYVSHKRARAMESGVEKQGEALENQNIQIELTRKSQIDERFKNAIEHLGSDKEPVILGGIAELNQIATENPAQYSEVVFNILCSYIRTTSSIKKKSNRYK